jgi:glutamate-5-semialdehyde dehydrogenase
LVHRAIAPDFLALALPALGDAGVTVHGDPAVQAYDPGVVPAQDVDWADEYLSLDIAIRIVDSLQGGLEHIRTWSSGHTEAIVTRSLAASRHFIAGCDSAAVMVNASTRFTDGEQLGMGAEIGISTQKLHARGPMGLTEMTSTKWVITGDGHIRE